MDISYDNAKLAHALILSGRATGQQAVFERGLQTLRWLMELQISEKGHFRPIGTNGFYRRGGERANFDQQPIEAQATVSACLEAYRATSDFWWYEQAQRAFDWFIGWNDLGLELYSPESGGCRDGLHVDRVNGNQGAESTLAFLLSLAEMRIGAKYADEFQAADRRRRVMSNFQLPFTFSGATSTCQFTSNEGHDPQARPVPRSSAALQSRGSPTRRQDHRQDHVVARRTGRPAPRRSLR